MYIFYYLILCYNNSEHYFLQFRLLRTKPYYIIYISAAELLREAEKLVEQKLHPQTVIAGWRIAVEAARQALAEASFDHEKSMNEAALRADLENIARTTLSSKILSNHKE